MSGHELPPRVAPDEDVRESRATRDGLRVSVLRRDTASCAQHGERSIEREARLVDDGRVVGLATVLLTRQVFGARGHRAVRTGEDELLGLDASKVRVVAIAIRARDIVLD